MNIPSNFSFTTEEMDIWNTMKGRLELWDKLFMAIPTARSEVPERYCDAIVVRAYWFDLFPEQYCDGGCPDLHLELYSDGKAVITAFGGNVGFDLEKSPLPFEKLGAWNDCDTHVYPSYEAAYEDIAEYYKWLLATVAVEEDSLESLSKEQLKAIEEFFETEPDDPHYSHLQMYVQDR